MDKTTKDFKVNSIMLNYNNKWLVQANSEGGDYNYIYLTFDELPDLKIGDYINGIFRQRIKLEEHEKKHRTI